MLFRQSTSTTTYVRFVNAISNASPMTLYAKNTTSGTETAIGAETAYKSAGAFVSIPGGTYDLSTRYTGTATNAIARTAVAFVPGVSTRSARGATSRSRRPPPSTGHSSTTPSTDRPGCNRETGNPGPPGFFVVRLHVRKLPAGVGPINRRRCNVGVIVIEITIILIAQQSSQRGIPEHINVIHRPAVDINGPVNESNAVAVIDVPVHVTSVQRLDGRAVELVPPVNRRPDRASGRAGSVR